MLRPYLLYPAWIACGVVLLGQALAPALLVRIQYLPFIASLLLFGLPHGALDHLVPQRLRGQRPTVGMVAIVAIAYLALVGLYLALWQLAPAAGLGLFVIISVTHWGAGDAFFLIAFLGRPKPSPLGLGVIWAVRGALPILLPPLIDPAALASLTRGIGHYYGMPGGWVIAPALRAAGLIALAVLVALYVAQAVAARRRIPTYLLWVDLLEIALLCALFWGVPSILSVGVYFCLWHSCRHIARLLLIDVDNLPLLAARRFGQPLRGFALDALPTTLGALALLGALYLTHRDAAGAPDRFVWLYLSLIAALTFPHLLIVALMDLRQGMLPTRRAHREQHAQT